MGLPPFYRWVFFPSRVKKEASHLAFVDGASHPFISFIFNKFTNYTDTPLLSNQIERALPFPLRPHFLAFIQPISEGSLCLWY